MKKFLATSIAAAAMTAGFTAPAQAEIEGLSANVGFVSDYYFRGAQFGNAAAYVGADYEIAGFYVGTWIIEDEGSNVQGGLETDFYAGYGMEFDSGFSFSVGASTYQYTYTSDSETEFGGTLGFAGFGLDVWLGEDSDDADDNGMADDLEQDYMAISVSWSGDVFGIALGNVDYDESESGADDDFSWNYAEVSAGGEIAGLDASVTMGTSFGADGDAFGVGKDKASGDGYVFIDVSKSFSF